MVVGGVECKICLSAAVLTIFLSALDKNYDSHYLYCCVFSLYLIEPYARDFVEQYTTNTKVTFLFQPLSVATVYNYTC